MQIYIYIYETYILLMQNKVRESLKKLSRQLTTYIQAKSNINSKEKAFT